LAQFVFFEFCGAGVAVFYAGYQADFGTGTGLVQNRQSLTMKGFFMSRLFCAVIMTAVLVCTAGANAQIGLLNGITVPAGTPTNNWGWY
jgi:hypothetical protein